MQLDGCRPAAEAFMLKGVQKQVEAGRKEIGEETPGESVWEMN